MNSNFKEIEELVSSLAPDANKFWQQGNASAGTRLRNGMQKLKELAQAERKAVSDSKEIRLNAIRECKEARKPKEV